MNTKYNEGVKKNTFFSPKVNVLGAEYSIYEVDCDLSDSSTWGECFFNCKEIYIRVKPKENDKVSLDFLRATLRHEIIRAFLHESGLSFCGLIPDIPWPYNEEAIDWLVIQGDKICTAWKNSGCLCDKEKE